MTEIIEATTADLIDEARALINEYSMTRPGDPALGQIADEIAGLPGQYAPPDGCLLLAYNDGEPQGCVALRRWDEATAEMKRLYVRPTRRGNGIGRALVLSVLDRARSLGYERMLLDTIPGMDRAQSLYRSLGFKEIAPYRNNPNPGTLYFELRLVG
ncbi:MAG TPA: GNAT family N-acetyltransferase [Blastocatellia bacterium]|nr:GNAT family N-acetyltransferase [Blastocatellia bacterium]